MHQVRNLSGLLVVVALAAALLPGCAPRSPEEKVAKLRSRYKARLNGFVVQQEPAFAEEAGPAIDEALEPLGEEIEESELIEVETLDVTKDVMLDVLIQHDSEEKLPGITVDISMVDSTQQEKGHWRAWFDTADIPKATITQRTHILEDVDYEEGDGFFLEVRHPVPPDEQSDYREFSSTGS